MHRVNDGVPVRLLSNDDFLVLQFFREADRDQFSGFDGAEARRALYLWLAEQVVVGRLAHLSGRTWVKALAEVYSTHGRVRPARSALDYLEVLRASSRANVNRMGSPADDRIMPGQEYGLDFHFDHAVTWAQSARAGQTNVLQCPEYTDSDIERAIRDRAFRKRPAGAAGDRPCHADITLQIEQVDTFEYRTDMPPAPDDSLFWLMTTCQELGYDSYSRGLDPRAGRYYCDRREVERSSRSVGTLAELEQGFYWVIPRQAVVFPPRADLARPGEDVAGVTMRLSLADDRGLYARDLHYEVDITRRDLQPAFDVMSDGTSLILDARASVVGPLVARDSVDYVWSYDRDGAVR